MVDRHQVDHLAEGIANFMAAIVEAEHADLAFELARLGDPGQRQDRLAQLDPKLAGAGADRVGGDFLDAVDDAEAERAARAVEPAEQQDRDLVATGAATGASTPRPPRSCASSRTPPTSARPAGSNSRIGLPSSASVVPA